MSYDLFVFDPKIAPRNRAEFMAWYESLTEWSEERDYSSPEGVTGNLRKFYEALKDTFPPMNGPDAYDFDGQEYIQTTKKMGFWERLVGRKVDRVSAEIKFNEMLVTDYSISKNAIYLSFSWSVANEAFEQVVSTARQTGVGFYDATNEEGGILHDPDQFGRIASL